MKWVKPNGNKIETNDDLATIRFCKKMGWEQEKAPVKKAAKKKAAVKRAKKDVSGN